MEGTDIPTGDTSTCPSYASFEVTLPEQTQPVTIHQGTRSCSGLFVHPFVIGFNGTFPSGDVVGSAPACKRSVNTALLPPMVQVEALSGSSLAGMVMVATSSKGSQPFQIILNPGRYTIHSPHDPSVENVVVRAGQSTQLGTYGGCYQVTSVPTPTTGLGNLPTTSTTSP